MTRMEPDGRRRLRFLGDHMLLIRARLSLPHETTSTRINFIS